MEQFRNNVSLRWDRRVADPGSLEHEAPLCALVICQKLDWPVDLFAQNKGTALKPLGRLKTEFHCARSPDAKVPLAGC
jgi:hypothetical protein